MKQYDEDLETRDNSYENNVISQSYNLDKVL